jgi:hemerythrin-like domain-containing protein
MEEDRMNLTNLDRQHRTIMDEISIIENEIMKGSEAINLSIAGLHISRLAGQLKIHLLEEDEFLYPKLLSSPEDSIKNLADQYIKEMGNLAAEYTLFKSKYNMANKINENLEEFLVEGKVVIASLKKRIEKENSGLYRLIKEKNII